MKHKTLMIPGPTEVSSEVLAKLALPVEPHYGDEFVKLYFKVIAKLKKIFETSNDIFILAAISSAAMESAVNCAVEKGDKVLVCHNGFFGERFEEIGLELFVEDRFASKTVTAVKLSPPHCEWRTIKKDDR